MGAATGNSVGEVSKIGFQAPASRSIFAGVNEDRSSVLPAISFEQDENINTHPITAEVRFIIFFILVFIVGLNRLPVFEIKSIKNTSTVVFGLSHVSSTQCSVSTSQYG